MMLILLYNHCLLKTKDHYLKRLQLILMKKGNYQICQKCEWKMFVIVINEGNKNIISRLATGGFLEEKVFLRRAYTMKYFFHRWLDFFSTVSFQHLTRLYSCKMWMKVFNLQSWKYFRRKNIYQIFNKNFFFWNSFHESKIKSLLKMT